MSLLAMPHLALRWQTAGANVAEWCTDNRNISQAPPQVHNTCTRTQVARKRTFCCQEQQHMVHSSKITTLHDVNVSLRAL